MKSTILFAHGSRDPLWRVPIELIAQRIQSLAPEQLVDLAYLKICLQGLVNRGATEVRIFPLFLGVGKHARQDLPLLVEEVKTLHPSIPIEVLPSAGEMPQVIEFLAQLALTPKN